MLDLIGMPNCLGSLFHTNNWSKISEEFQKANGLVALQSKENKRI